MSNELCKEGLKFILETVFPASQSVPANYYMGLCEDASIAEDAALADLTELAVANGYARQLIPSGSVTGWTSEQAGTNDWKVTSITVTFTASGTWNGAEHAFLASSSDDSGFLIACGALSVERFLTNGDTLQVSMVIQLNG